MVSISFLIILPPSALARVDAFYMKDYKLKIDLPTMLSITNNLSLGLVSDANKYADVL